MIISGTKDYRVLKISQGDINTVEVDQCDMGSALLSACRHNMVNHKNSASGFKIPEEEENILAVAWCSDLPGSLEFKLMYAGIYTICKPSV